MGAPVSLKARLFFPCFEYRAIIVCILVIKLRVKPDVRPFLIVIFTEASGFSRLRNSFAKIPGSRLFLPSKENSKKQGAFVSVKLTFLQEFD